ncbi:MAG: group I intron-associated PD-(D/E)XK endonuclease [bacterium]|nr:group I intron-associated PD-(D/E)XK endonuclease [bacterium]
MNSKRKGSLAVGEAVAYFVRNGTTVLIPVSDCDKYDLAIDQQGSIKRVQCKYSNDRERSGAFIVDLRTFGGYREKTYHTKYLKDDFDLLFIYCTDGTKYLIPAEKIVGKSQMAVGAKSWNDYKC